VLFGGVIVLKLYAICELFGGELGMLCARVLRRQLERSCVWRIFVHGACYRCGAESGSLFVCESFLFVRLMSKLTPVGTRERHPLTCGSLANCNNTSSSLVLLTLIAPHRFVAAIGGFVSME